jgi:hypothetical protein
LDDRRFGVVDIDRWAEQGLISRKQASAILRAEGLHANDTARAGDDDHGLTVITLFSYLGAFLALTGIAIFAAINWGDMSTVGRVALMLPVTIGLLGAGYHLRSQTSYRLGGNLLFLVGTALVPVTIFAIASAFGSSDSDKFFSEKDLPAATGLLALSVVLTAAMVVLTRVPQATLVPTGLVVVLAGAAAAWWFGSDESDELWSAVMAAGGLLVGLSIALTAYKAREHGFWVSVGGHVGLYVGATTLLCGLHWSPISAAAFLTLYVAILLLSIPLQSRVFLIAGVAGVYTIVIRATIQEATGASLPLAFAVIGLSLIGVAMLYQRARHEWATNLP